MRLILEETLREDFIGGFFTIWVHKRETANKFILNFDASAQKII